MAVSKKYDRAEILQVALSILMAKHTYQLGGGNLMEVTKRLIDQVDNDPEIGGEPNKNLGMEYMNFLSSDD